MFDRDQVDSVIEGGGEVGDQLFSSVHLSYNDLSTCVVEEVAEVAIVMEAGEVKGEATRYSGRGACWRLHLTCQEDHPAWCSLGA